MFAVCAASALTSSCDSMIYDDQGDCTVHYRVPFTYTHNILSADAFASQVSAVTLYVFDSKGNLVLQKSDSGTTLAAGGYRMDVDLPAGIYDMIAWCTGTSPMPDPTAFKIGGGDTPASPSQLTATLPLKGETGDKYVNQDITPLFHGMIQGVECKESDYGYIDLPAIDLMKDTNVIKVILNNIDGTELNPDDFKMEITGTNSEMDYENNLVGDAPFSYLPWSISRLVTDKEENRAPVASGMMAELSMGRLMTDRQPRLKVTRCEDKTEIINLNLIQFFLLVKGHYQAHWSNQEYLDRLDEYSLTFFIDKDKNWYTAAGININSWHVVPPQEEDWSR